LDARASRAKAARWAGQGRPCSLGQRQARAEVAPSALLHQKKLRCESDLHRDGRPREVCSKHPEGTAMQAYLKAMAIMAGLLGIWVVLLPLVA
jgi:hypothetical protein